MAERAQMYERLRKLPRAEVIAEAQRASRVNGITGRTSKLEAIYFILDSRLPVW